MAANMILKLPGITFQSKVSVAEYVRKMVDRNEPGMPLRGEDHAVTEAVFSIHPDYQEKKAGRKVSHFEVRPYKFRKRTLFAVFEDGSFVDFSWKKAINELWED